jgi:hypothetical protein
MNSRFACLIAAGFVIAAGSRTMMSAAGVPLSPGNVEILVGWAPQPQYAHDGRRYVEAQNGREYAIRLRNPYGVRVAVALSVDGLNTIDARETTAASARKWVLGPYETITISGWQTSRAEARRFEFTTEARSYGQALGKTANLGVISAVFFKERVASVISNNLKDAESQRPAASQSPVPAAPEPATASAAAAGDQKAPVKKDEFAATGMGRRTDHAVVSVWLDLEESPVQTVDIRYEFRPQLVRLGILPPAPTVDPLERREHARGFEPGFSPEPPRQR